MSSGYGDIEKKFTLTKKIGSGGTSKVYLAHSNDNPKLLYAVKIIKPSNNKDNSESKVFNNEINVLKKIKHENVVGLIDGGSGTLTKFETGKKYTIEYLVLELVKYGELFDYIFFPQKGFGEEIGRYIATQLINGLDSIHKAGIAHRDMKTENIMLAEGWKMKIADFGFSTKVDGKKGNGLLYTALGTASYASPELLQKKPYLGIPSDIFSLGVSLFVLVTGKMPFKHALVDDPYYKEIVQKNYEKYWAKLESKVPSTSKEFKAMFVQLIAYDPTSRLSLDELRKDPWIKGKELDFDQINSEFSARTQLVQYKKELERLKEEQEEKNKKEGFKIYKDGKVEEVEYIPTSNEFTIKEIDQNHENNYIISFPNETEPGVLLDYLFDKFKTIQGANLLKVNGKYQLALGFGIDLSNPEKDQILGDEVIHDNIEALIEIKRQGENLVVEFERTTGEKFDFHSLFLESVRVLEKDLKKDIKELEN